MKSVNSIAANAAVVATRLGTSSFLLLLPNILFCRSIFFRLLFFIAVVLVIFERSFDFGSGIHTNFPVNGNSDLIINLFDELSIAVLFCCVAYNLFSSFVMSVSNYREDIFR